MVERGCADAPWQGREKGRAPAYGEKIPYGETTTGVIQSTVWVGPDGTVRKHWARVADAAKHPAQVLETLRRGAA